MLNAPFQWVRAAGRGLKHARQVLGLSEKLSERPEKHQLWSYRHRLRLGVLVVNLPFQAVSAGLWV